MIDNEMWEAAKFVVEWDYENLRYKLFIIPRKAIDDEEGPHALYVVGIDSGGVRAVEELLDPEYSRLTQEDADFIKELIEAEATPDEAMEMLKYIKKEVNNHEERKRK